MIRRVSVYFIAALAFAFVTSIDPVQAQGHSAQT
jgi:hypothetical protein